MAGQETRRRPRYDEGMDPVDLERRELWYEIHGAERRAKQAFSYVQPRLFEEIAEMELRLVEMGGIPPDMQSGK